MHFIYSEQLLDELSGMFANPQNPKLAPVAKKIFNQFGREVVDVFTLQTDDQIWVSFGEPYISPFSKCCYSKSDHRSIWNIAQLIEYKGN